MSEVTLTEADLPAIDRLLKKMRAEESTPMLTLDEVVAKYKVALKAVLDGFFEAGVNAALKGPTGNAEGAGTPLVAALDAAVRDVAIEAMRQMQERSGYVWEGAGELKAEINRLLGDHPHG